MWCQAPGGLCIVWCPEVNIHQLYRIMKSCERCGSSNVIKSNLEFYDMYPKSDSIRTQDRRTTHAISMTGLKPNARVFYFATTPGPVTDRDSAYGRLQNSGVAETDATGAATFHLQCPRVYRTPAGDIFPRHFHWVYRTSAGWGRTVYTKQFFCPVSKAFVKRAIKSGDFIVVDALPEEYYEKDHIPGAVSMPHNQPLKTDALGVDKTRPLILYCWSPECSAAEHLNSRLQKLGWLNTYHYEDGISNWHSK
jgi:rhodanese-related sulfurtransferase